MSSLASAVGPLVARLTRALRPPDAPSHIALLLGVALVLLALVPGGPHLLASALDLPSSADVRRRRRFLVFVSFVAAFLSLGYIALYLRGGPRADEAATYWLDGRVVSKGAFTWAAPEPLASFHTRDIVFRPPDRFAIAVPPGFPLLLAAGFLVGAPMLVGPLLAALLVLATWLLAHEVLVPPPPPPGAPSWGHPDRRAEITARIAAGLSIASAALRYHTADTLPYAAAAAGLALALVATLRAHRTNAPGAFGLAGLALSALVAVAPPSALTMGMVAIAWAARSPGRRRSLASLALGVLPGLVFVALASRAATGHFFARSPVWGWPAPGSADVDAGAMGLGAMVRGAALRHLVDVANLEPLLLLAFVPFLRARTGRVAALGWVIGGQAAVQAVLLAVGHRPEAGADGLLAVVPVEHVLMAVGLAILGSRALVPSAVGLLGLALIGFGVHAAHAHQAIAFAGNGRPAFEPDVLRESGVTSGLLLFDDDSGYELALDPAVTASHGVAAARLRGDDHDRLLADTFGHPAAHRYVVKGSTASVVNWSPTGAGDSWRFEAESDWPPLGTTNAAVSAIAAPMPCASGGKALRIAAGAAGGEATIDVPIPYGATVAGRRRWIVTPRIVGQRTGAKGKMTLHTDGSVSPVEWTLEPDRAASCLDLPGRAIELSGDRARAWLTIQVSGGPLLLDRLTLLRDLSPEPARPRRL